MHANTYEHSLMHAYIYTWYTEVQNCLDTHTMAHREEAATTLEAHCRRAPLAAGKIKPETPGGGGLGGGVKYFPCFPTLSRRSAYYTMEHPKLESLDTVPRAAYPRAHYAACSHGDGGCGDRPPPPLRRSTSTVSVWDGVGKKRWSGGEKKEGRKG
jgi:hypothetical protein